MRSSFLSVLALMCLATSAHSQLPITLSGHVTSSGGGAIQNARVWLMMQDEVASTDAGGAYNIAGTTGTKPARAQAGSVLPDARIAQGAVVLGLSHSQNVDVGVFGADGRRLRQIASGTYAAGKHRFDLGVGPGDGVRFVRVHTTDGHVVLKVASVNKQYSNRGPQSSWASMPALAKTATVGIDTIVFTALGYLPLVLPIDTLDGVYDAVLTPGAPSPAVNGMRQIAGGSFRMGDSSTTSPTRPVHDVTVTGFYMDTTEVTQARYMTVMGISPPVALGFSYDHQLPVESVTWFDAALFCNRQSRIDGRDTVYSYTSLTGTPGYGTTAMAGLIITHTNNGYRLPTEAQWEYACRGGTTGDYSWGSADSADPYLWYADNSNAMSHPVAQKRPNPFGLYDINGNVWEWTNDWNNTYPATAQIDPTGPATPGTQATRIVRGGSQDNDTTNITVHMRQIWFQPSTRFMTIGFRTVRPLN